MSPEDVASLPFHLDGLDQLVAFRLILEEVFRFPGKYLKPNITEPLILTNARRCGLSLLFFLRH